MPNALNTPQNLSDVDDSGWWGGGVAGVGGVGVEAEAEWTRMTGPRLRIRISGGTEKNIFFFYPWWTRLIFIHWCFGVMLGR